jgi:protease IV
MKQPTLAFGRIIGIVFIVYLVSSVLALLVLSAGPMWSAGNVAVIDLRGPIFAEGAPASLLAAGYPGSNDYVDRIERAAADDRFDAIVIRINSGGGSPVGSREIVEAVTRVEKPLVVFIREIGASGAYWVAAASDHIVADPLAITGSVGVRASYLEFSELFDEYGITYVDLDGGAYKSTGSPFTNISDEERSLLLERIDYLHDYFLDSVIELRNLSSQESDELELIGSGIYFIGDEAVSLGLIDELGSWNRIEEVLEERGVSDVEYAYLRMDRSPLADLAGFSRTLGHAIGTGIGSVVERDSRPTLR